MLFRRCPTIVIAFLLIIPTACVRSAPTTVNGSVPVWVTGQASANATVPSPTISRATPSFHLQPTRIPGSPFLTPTPDILQILPSPVTGPETYIVQRGETLGAIAQRFGLSVELLTVANELIDPDTLSEGQVLVIPHATPLAFGSSFKIIPDSELVYGPMSITLDITQFANIQGGYLAGYRQDVDGEQLTGAQVILRVAQFYSVNPRLLLTLLEYRAGWVTNPFPDPATLNEPLGLRDGWHVGLYRQLTWAANALNRGYYLWRVNGVAEWTLADGSVIPVEVGINAGTAGVQAFFAGLDDTPTWQRDISVGGFYATYQALFGYPFDLAIEPIVPTDLRQPQMQLPFEKGMLWAFTSGPHAGWDSGSAWAALDFAPAGTEGCVQSEAWVTAIADGLIVRSGYGAVVQDLDNDSFEQTGWTVLYMHIEERGRVQPGTYVRTGDQIGHPSCEGGFGDATHLHLARRFNGEWIPGDGTVPFNLDGWISSGTGVEYDGYLVRSGQAVEAFNGNNAINQIQR